MMVRVRVHVCDFIMCLCMFVLCECVRVRVCARYVCTYVLTCTSMHGCVCLMSPSYMPDRSSPHVVPPAGECVSGMWIGRALTTSVTGAAVSHASDILGHAEGKYTTHYRVNTSLTIPLPVLYHQVKHDCCGCRECNVISIVF